MDTSIVIRICLALLMTATAIEAFQMFGYDVNIFSSPSAAGDEATLQDNGRSSPGGNGASLPPQAPAPRRRAPTSRGRRVIARSRQNDQSPTAYSSLAGCNQFDSTKSCECKGPNGLKGAQGDKGPRGEEGDIGSQGKVGRVGEQGHSGESGDQGPRGDKGDRGDSFPGQPGKQGVPGCPGDHGDFGDKGLQGPQGPVGDVGPRGPRGEPGLNGLPGEPGNSGKPGEQGPMGEQGAEGRQGLPGSPGKKGDKGLAGSDGGKGEKGSQGVPGAKGDKGDRGERGDRGDSIKGDKGVKGDKGAKGTKGISGEEAGKGAKGLRGQRGVKGEPGISIRGDVGNKGLSGEDGEVGDKGEKGIRGEKGRPAAGVVGERGLPGPAGDRGDQGEPGKMGPIGDKGFPGARGDVGETGKQGDSKNLQGEPGDPGLHGSKGARGEKGPRGDPGEEGMPGKSGLKGDQGPHGQKGEKGEADCIRPPGQDGDMPFIHGGQVYARHSQSTAMPTQDIKNRGCPQGHTFLWGGYSLLHTEDGGRANVQDLGAAGSCIRTFMPTPFIRAFETDEATIRHHPSQSYWLSAYDGKNRTVSKPTQMLREDAAIKPYISRCAVCMARGPVLAIHSQSTKLPECPSDKWTKLWEGYSFVMHSVGRAAGGQRLESPGSCLPYYRAHPFIECNADQTCFFFSDKMSYWLMADPDDSSKILSALEMTNQVSRCVVCADDELLMINDDLAQGGSFELTNARL